MNQGELQLGAAILHAAQAPATSWLPDITRTSVLLPDGTEVGLLPCEWQAIQDVLADWFRAAGTSFSAWDVYPRRDHRWGMLPDEGHRHQIRGGRLVRLGLLEQVADEPDGLYRVAAGVAEAVASARASGCAKAA